LNKISEYKSSAIGRGTTMLGTAIGSKKFELIYHLIKNKRDKHPIYAFLLNAQRQSKEEKIEILKTIDRYENFGKIFKQDVILLQENGLMGQKVKENVLLTKEFYDGVEIDRLFGTIETTTDIIDKLEIQVSELKSTLVNLQAELDSAKKSEEKLTSDLNFVKTEKEKLQKIFAESQHSGFDTAYVTRSFQKKIKIPEAVEEPFRIKQQTSEDSQKVAELKNKILSSSNFNNLENSEGLPRIRALRKSSVFQNSAADMETKRPDKPRVDDIMQGLIHGETSQNFSAKSDEKENNESSASRAYRRMPSRMPRMSSLKNFSDFDQEEK